MSWLVTRIVASSPPGTWLEDLVRVLAKCADTSGVRRWQLRYLEVDSRDERAEVPPDPPWDRLRALALAPSTWWLELRGTQTGKTPDLIADVPVRAVFDPRFEPTELSSRLFSSLPPLLVSERQPRPLSIAVRAAPLAGDAERMDDLVLQVTELSRAAGGVWAQIGLSSHPATTWHPAQRGWTREAAPLVRRRVPELAWWMLAGAGHVEALGGQEAAAARLGAALLRSDARELEIRCCDAPVGQDAAERSAVRSALAPVRMQPPVDPSPQLLFVDRSGEPHALTDLSWRRLADGTLLVDPEVAAAPRGELAGSSDRAERLQRLYSRLPELGRLGADPWIYVPRLVGDRHFLRVGGGRLGCAVWDSGEPMQELARLGLVLRRPPSRARRAALEAAMAAWSDLIDLPVAPCVEWQEERGIMEVPVDRLRDDAFLLLVLALDRTARASRLGLIGVVVGPGLTPAEIERRWREGEPPFDTR